MSWKLESKKNKVEHWLPPGIVVQTSGLHFGKDQRSVLEWRLLIHTISVQTGGPHHKTFSTYSGVPSLLRNTEQSVMFKVFKYNGSSDLMELRK